ncbi:hypothetical protein ACMD2_18657 [Ananas comosus]|uniref:Uncharacterized protein n=1 Tax=Ananas comosus TaxID=4615 RepID=A0A199VVD1_ANACO|nr:hypothetical protein ACMD2_18657 [Ananas comosus]
MAAGLQLGCAALSRAASPEACGHAIDVSKIMLNLLYSSSEPTVPTVEFSAQAARICVPGMTTSGFRTCGLLADGPREV